MESKFLKTVLSSGYKKRGYGYKKVTENVTHWITLFENNSFQMYAYENEDVRMENVYSTGIIKNADIFTFQKFIDLLTSNHN